MSVCHIVRFRNGHGVKRLLRELMIGKPEEKIIECGNVKKLLFKKIYNILNES